jgi:hypothetical protein
MRIGREVGWSRITDDNLWRPTRRAEGHYTKYKLWTRRGAVHSIGWLFAGRTAVNFWMRVEDEDFLICQSLKEVGTPVLAGWICIAVHLIRLFGFIGDPTFCRDSLTSDAHCLGQRGAFDPAVDVGPGRFGSRSSGLSWGCFELHEEHRRITDDNLWRPARRAEEHYTRDKLSTRRGAVHSIGWLCSSRAASG